MAVAGNNEIEHVRACCMSEAEVETEALETVPSLLSRRPHFLHYRDILHIPTSA